MRSPDAEPSALIAAPLDFRVAAVKIRIEGPDPVLELLNTTLSNVPRFDSRLAPDMTITVSACQDAWEIRGVDGSRNVLATHSAMPQIGGAVVTRAVSDVATSCEFQPLRAAIVERNGHALAMVGDDWESAVTLATHLHARGWRFIGTDHGLFDPATQQVHCIQKSLYVNALSVSQLPLRYRRAVEASPWYVTPRGMWFYAVDPTAAGMNHTWTSSAVLTCVLFVDGTMVDVPHIEHINARRLDDERFRRLGIDWSAVGVAELHIGGSVDTCDLIESWFSSATQ